MKSRTLFTRLLLAAGLFVSGAATADVTMATWGGAYGDAFKKHLAEPFEKETGIKVNLVYGNSLSNYQRLVAQKQKPQIDIVTPVILGGSRSSSVFRPTGIRPGWLCFYSCGLCGPRDGKNLKTGPSPPPHRR